MEETERQKHTIDARGRILGRLSTEAANLLRGKNKINFSYNQDHGDYVVIINAQDIRLTGKKVQKKVYYYHTGWPRGLREKKLKEIIEEKPEKVLELAISRMLPKNRLKKNWLKRLKIYRGDKDE